MLPASEAGGESGSAWSKKRDMSDYTTWMTLDVITDLLYGETLDLLRSDKYRWIPNAFRMVQWRNLIVSPLTEGPASIVGGGTDYRASV